MTDAWQATASLQLRRGDPAAATTYAAHQRLDTVHPALLASRVARLHDAVNRRGESLAITWATSTTARAINIRSNATAATPTAPGRRWWY